MDDMKRVGALWMNISKNGNKYFKGTVFDKKVVIFERKKKEGDKETTPDYTVYEDTPKA